MIEKMPIFKPSLFIAFLCFVVISFFTSQNFKSTSIIDVSIQEDNIQAPSIFDNFSTSSSKNAFQLKSFLESEEASLIFLEKIDVKKYFSSTDISIISRYREGGLKSFHDYYLNKIKITIDGDSNSIYIDTFAFTPLQAKEINLKIINIAADFFSRKARLTSINTKANKICELYSINSNILNLDPSDFNYDLQTGIESSTANELLLSKSRQYRDFCLEKLNSTELKEEGINIFPTFELRNINVDASKQVLIDIYEKSLDSITPSTNIEIISEPVLASRPEPRNSLIYSSLAFIISIIILLTSKILFRMKSEFEI